MRRLLRLNPGARGEHLTSQLTWEAAWLLVTRIFPIYLADEFSPCVLWLLMIELMVVLFDAFLMVSMVLLLWWDDAIPKDGYKIEGQNWSYVALLQRSEMSAGYHYR